MTGELTLADSKNVLSVDHVYFCDGLKSRNLPKVHFSAVFLWVLAPFRSLVYYVYYVYLYYYTYIYKYIYINIYMCMYMYMQILIEIYVE